MNRTTSARLAAVLLVCLAPLAASATEADLSPPLNGGSGHMPSGYSQLNFYLGNAYWAAEVRLPVRASAGNAVMLDTVAEYSSRLLLEGTAFAKVGGVELKNPQTLRFIWNDAARAWDVQDSAGARSLIGPNRAEDTIPASKHQITQYTMEDGRHAGTLRLPSWAPDHALVAVANRALWGTTVVGDGLTKMQQRCAGSEDCTFIFDGARQQWQKVEARHTLSPMVQLPFPQGSVTSVITDPASLGPLQMTLPKTAVDGDIYAFLHTHDLDTYQVMPANTSMPAALVLPTGKEVRFRFDRPTSRWEKID